MAYSVYVVLQESSLSCDLRLIKIPLVITVRRSYFLFDCNYQDVPINSILNVAYNYMLKKKKKSSFYQTLFPQNCIFKKKKKNFWIVNVVFHIKWNISCFCHFNLKNYNKIRSLESVRSGPASKTPSPCGRGSVTMDCCIALNVFRPLNVCYRW